jgi:hypothetical protein
MKHVDRRQITGWVAVGASTVITCFWGFWGIIENFHEGWYYESLLSNVGLMLVQYLSPHVILALLAAWFFQAFTNTVMFLLIAPLIGIGALYWFGRPQPRKIALSLVIGLPIMTLFVSGIEPGLRVSQRIYDGDLQARLVPGNGVNLIWAPDGPGWPRRGTNWSEAQQACQYLDDDGLTLAAVPQHVWRLPTVDEAVRSMARRGQNSGGVWDAETAKATYKTTPDKESPLWNVYSQVIYWWTATEPDEEHAYIIVYDGKVWPRAKQFSAGYLGFRCVKQG